MLPHETAVGWAREYLKKRPLSKGAGIEAMEGELRRLMTECAAYINANFDVSGLCRSFPKRFRELKTAERERLSH